MTKVTGRLLLVGAMIAIVSPVFAEKVANYLLNLRMGSHGGWAVSNTTNRSVNFLIIAADGDKYWGVVAPGGTNESTVNSGKDYHIYACYFPDYAVDSDTGKAPTFSSKNWDCSPHGSF